MIIFGYEISAWRILFIFAVFCMAAWSYFAPFTLEGFQSGSGEFNQLIGCPAIQNTIVKHKELLEGYTEKNAVVSMDHTREVLDVFTKSFNDYGCETYLKNMPVKETKKEVKVEEKKE